MNVQETITVGRNGKMTKVERYGWIIKDSPGKLEQIHKNALFIDPSYQREATEPRVRALASAWSWVACSAIVVARRSSGYWIIDGQHRVLAAKTRSDITTLPCIVFDVQDVHEEAVGFLSANTNRRPMSAYEKFRALVMTEDQTAVKLSEIFDSLGIRVVKGKAEGALTTKSVSCCLQYCGKNAETFDLVASVAARLCATLPISERIFRGLWWLHANGVDLRTKRVLNRLLDVGATRLLDGASRAIAYHGRGDEKTIGEGMLVEINKNLHTKIVVGG